MRPRCHTRFYYYMQNKSRKPKLEKEKLLCVTGYGFKSQLTERW